MNTVPLQVPHTRKPDGPVEIDWSNPITRGMVGCWMVDDKHGYKDITGHGFDGVIGTGTEEPQPVISGVGRGLKFSQTNSTFINIPTIPGTHARRGFNYLVARYNTDFTMLAHIGPISGVIVCEGGGGSSGNHAMLWATPNDVQFHMKNENLKTAASSGLSLADGKGHTILGRKKGGAPGLSGTLYAYADGEQVGSSPGPSDTGQGTIVTSNLNIGRKDVSPTKDHGSGDIGLVANFNRSLSDAESKSITANPWQILKPRTRQIFIPAAGGGSILPMIQHHNHFSGGTL